MFSKTFLRTLRNDISVETLIRDTLRLPHKYREGYFRFLCPVCRDFHTAVNSKTNLARCFRCKKNFNPIDMVMTVNNCDFRRAVEFLEKIMPQVQQP